MFSRLLFMFCMIFVHVLHDYCSSSQDYCSFSLDYCSCFLDYCSCSLHYCSCSLDYLWYVFLIIVHGLYDCCSRFPWLLFNFVVVVSFVHVSRLFFMFSRLTLFFSLCHISRPVITKYNFTGHWITWKQMTSKTKQLMKRGKPNAPFYLRRSKIMEKTFQNCRYPFAVAFYHNDFIILVHVLCDTFTWLAVRGLSYGMFTYLVWAAKYLLCNVTW